MASSLRVLFENWVLDMGFFFPDCAQGVYVINGGLFGEEADAWLLALSCLML